MLSIELILTTGSKAGTAAPIQRGYYMIGRHGECQIRPKSRSVSRRHCLLHHGELGLAVLDLRSTRGTHINEEKIGPQTWVRLHDGDQIRCGKITFAVAIKQAAPVAAGVASSGKAAARSSDAWEADAIAEFLESEDDAEREQRYGEIRTAGRPRHTSDSDAGELDAYADTPLETDDSTPVEPATSSKTKTKGKKKPKAKNKAKPPKLSPKQKRGSRKARKQFSFSMPAIAEGESWKFVGAVLLAVAFLGFFGYQMYQYSSGPDFDLIEELD